MQLLYMCSIVEDWDIEATVETVMTALDVSVVSDIDLYIRFISEVSSHINRLNTFDQ